jgi:hypothetical protein
MFAESIARFADAAAVAELRRSISKKKVLGATPAAGRGARIAAFSSISTKIPVVVVGGGDEEQREIGMADKQTIQERFVVKNISEVALFFEVGERTVSRWRQAGCPGERGKFDLQQICKWLRTEIGGYVDHRWEYRPRWHHSERAILDQALRDEQALAELESTNGRRK